MTPQTHEFAVAWARIVAVAVTALCGLHLAAVLSFGSFALTTDLTPLVCFDGTEPGCELPSEGAVGLGAIKASSWVLGSVAVVAVMGAFGMSFRIRRLASVVPVLALAATSSVIAHVLFLRL